MILRGLVIGDRLFGGRFDTDKHNDMVFIRNEEGFDQDLSSFLDPGKNTFNKLPYNMDIWEKKKVRRQATGTSRTGGSQQALASPAKIGINTHQPTRKNLEFKDNMSLDDMMSEFYVGPNEEFNKQELNRGNMRDKILQKNKTQKRKTFLLQPSENRQFKNLPNGTLYTSYEELTEEFITCAALNHECVLDKKSDGTLKYEGSSPDEIAICKGAKKIGCEFKGNELGTSSLDYFGTKLKYEVKMVKFNFLNFF